MSTVARPDATAFATHEVRNQSRPFEDVDVFALDLALVEGLEREGGGWAVDRVRDCGVVAGSAEAHEHGRRAERHEPRLVTHDRFGRRAFAGHKAGPPAGEP